MAHTVMHSGDAPSEKLKEDTTRLTESPDLNPKGETEKYNVTDYSYPEGISSDLDKQHYIQFFINVRGNSKFNEGEARGREQMKNNVLEGVTVGSGQNRIDPNRSAEKLTQTAAFATGGTAGIAVGSAIVAKMGIKSGKKVVQKTAKTEPEKGVTKGQAGGIIGTLGTIGGGTGLAVLEGIQEGFGLLKEDVPKRLKDVITLHIQDRPAVNYGVSYQESELGLVGGGILAGGQGASDAIGLNKDSAKETTAALATQVVAGASSILGAVGGVNAGRLLQAGTKQITNPFREQFFERVDFRTFNFRHTFMPKSEEEAKKVREIIKMFKFHMHPELVGGLGLMFLYPSEFEIKYMYRDQENDYFNRISTCVLEDMNVEYGGDIFATFETGQPVEVNMTLRFKELEVLTKERIAEGF